MQSNTKIVCSHKISTSEFSVTVDGECLVKRSKLIGELKYDDPRIFNYFTLVGNFTAQLGKIHTASPSLLPSAVLRHNDNSSNSFLHFIGKHLINKTLSDPSTPSPSFKHAQQVLLKFYNLKRFFTILFRVAQNQDRIFVRAGKMPRSEVGELESLKLRMSMDLVMFYIAVAILGF